MQTLDSRIDAQSRVVSVRAILDNRDHALLPGIFEIARLDLEASREVLAVQQTAVSFNPYGDFVYVLTPKGARSKAAWSLASPPSTLPPRRW